MDRDVNILGLIVARGGSKGLPRKNLRLVAGKPLLYWTFDAARRSRLLTRTILSTDDDEIAEYARSEQMEVPFMRPAELATDAAMTIDVTLHALQWLESQERYKPDYVVLLQPTVPLRTAEDIDAGITQVLAHGGDALVSVTACTNHPCLARTIDARGVLEPFMATPLAASRKQELPPVYALNGAVYVVRSAVLREQYTWHPTGALAYVMPAERSLDIDSEWDLKLADMILRSRSDTE